jgi:hypothetical protein
MNQIIRAILVFLVSVATHATPGISEQVLSAELAEDLGFTVAAEKEGPAISITLSGPLEVKNGCYPGRSGSYLIGPDGEELMAHITELNKGFGKPKAFGYVIGTINNMGVFIDYFCPKGRELESTRYTVPSIKQWLITRQASGQ